MRAIAGQILRELCSKLHKKRGDHSLYKKAQPRQKQMKSDNGM
ncbi:hypothetical protein SAMN02745166_04876 [Prosthecobacter debontii]|uniref:Uncharacterized protein n=1 Tax=Prosthecobacter debontii TaxID=48467 RepID=A0A1T4Z2E5_9BACT|nr:hypothetical protein SAMN02745166_04876 [Prosthecobacter debontii]